MERIRRRRPHRQSQTTTRARLTRAIQTTSTTGTTGISPQIRARVLNDDLAADFHRWYPNFAHTKTQDDHTLAA